MYYGEPASVDQISTFWAMLADRRWDNTSQLIPGRKPRWDYRDQIKSAYKHIKDGSASKQEISDVIEDLYCFKGYEVERRLRNVR